MSFSKIRDVETEETLCKWFEERPMYYNMRDDNYRNKHLKDRLLKERADIIGISGKCIC